MPLIDEQTSRTDRRSTSPWPWVIVVGSLALLWVLVSVGVSLVSRSTANQPPLSAPAAAQAVNADFLRQAQMAHSYGNWAGAVGLIKSINQEAPMSVSDKHTYYRVAAESLTKSGEPLEGARYYERFLSMGTRIHTPECRSCHPASGPSLPPTRLTDLRSSTLGASYVYALKSARKLDDTRRTLREQWRREPENPRLNLLLYHLQKAGGNAQEAAAHLKAMETWDEKQAGSAAQ